METNKGFSENEKETKRTGRYKLIGKIFLIALVAVIAVLAVKRVFFTEESIETETLSTVSVGHAASEDISVETSLVGTVMPGDVYYVIPKVSGEIDEIYVQTGDTVNEGDPICHIDNSKSVDAARISLDSAKVQLQTAEDGLELAKTNLDRMQVLLGTGDISQQTYETTKNSYDQAAAGVDSARLQLDSAQLSYDTQVEYSTVTSPVSGVIDSTDMSINGMVSSAGSVCVVSSVGDSKVTFSVTDRLLDALSVGTPITVTKQGTDYEGKITSVASFPSSTTGLYDVEGHFTGSESFAKGSSVKVRFISEEADGALVVDTDDIHYDGGKTYVYTLTYNDEGSSGDSGTADSQSIISENNRPGTVHKNEVETGISNSERTQVLSGIDGDSLIIVSWTSQLYEGAQVQVLPEA